MSEPFSDRAKNAPTEGLKSLPPNSAEAEEGVLACCLLAPKTAIPAYLGLLGENYLEAFYTLQSRTIFKVILKLHDKNEAVDAITVYQRLKDANVLDGCGGIEYISALGDKCPSAANVSQYAEIMRVKLMLRRAIQAGGNMADAAMSVTTESQADEVLDQVESDVHQLSSMRTVRSTREIKDVVSSAVNMIESIYSGEGEAVGIKTGFSDLDWLWGGMRNGEMIVIAARPSVGKTTCMMNIVEHAVLELNLPVGVFSMEMSADQLMLRSICARSGVNLHALKNGQLGETDFARIATTAARLSKSKLIIDDTPGLSIMQLRTRARRMQQQYDTKLFAIDYLQLLHATGRRAQENRQQEISDISTGIKELACELNVPIITLAQLNRDIEKDKKRKPRLSDLRESGSIEQTADIIGFLYDPERGERDDDKEMPESLAINLLTAKHRNGPTGETKFTFMRCFTRFELAAKIADSDVPNH